VASNPRCLRLTQRRMTLADTQAVDAFRSALNSACGELNEAARLATELFSGDELKLVRRELARLMVAIRSDVLSRLKT